MSFQSSSPQPTTSCVVASGATLTADIYLHLLALVPELAMVAPDSALAWVTTTPSLVEQQQNVQVYVFKTADIPSAPQYSNHPCGNATNMTCLPDPNALIATMTFTDAFTIQSPVLLGPAAPDVPPHLQLHLGKGKDKSRKTIHSLPEQEHVRAAYMWCDKQASAQGKLLPWPASAAALALVGQKPKKNARLFKDRLLRLFTSL